MVKRAVKHGLLSPVEGETIIRDGGYKREDSVTIFHHCGDPSHQPSLCQVQPGHMDRKLPINRNIFHTCHRR